MEERAFPATMDPDYENFLLEIWSHEKFDNYWQQVGLCAEAHYDGFADVPQVHMGSWYDPYARSTTDNFVGLSLKKHGPVVLIMGPWTHGARSVTHAGDADRAPCPFWITTSVGTTTPAVTFFRSLAQGSG